MKSIFAKPRALFFLLPLLLVALAARDVPITVEDVERAAWGRGLGGNGT